jgi:hypothetical protein
MSIANLFNENDYSIKCKELEVSGDVNYDGNVIFDGNVRINGELQDVFGVGGNNYNIFTSTGTKTAWRENINGFHLSTGPSFITDNEYMGQGYVNPNDNFTNYVVSQPMTICCFAVRATIPPGGADSFIFELHRNGVATGHIATISGLNTVATSPQFNLGLSQFEVFSIKMTIVGSPAVSTGSCTLDYIYNF